MAFDGITVSCLVHEWNRLLVGGRITKISQPEHDELLLTIKNYDTYRLQLSVSASLPMACITDTTKTAPLTAPNFCMLLRKHLNSARILEISQPDLERVIRIKVEHLDELGDTRIKWLMIELMGKHSNLIFCDEELTIVDSIKRVSSFVSSVREVLPGRKYFIPQTTEKHSVLNTPPEELPTLLASYPMELSKSIYQAFVGVSPVLANELCHQSGCDPSLPVSAQTPEHMTALVDAFSELKKRIETADFQPCIIQKDDEPIEFAAFPLTCYTHYDGYVATRYDDMSTVLLQYYREKEARTRIRQKSSELRRTVQTAVERTAKKLELQRKQLSDTEKKDRYRIYGELLTTYGYAATPGAKELTCTNYYDNKDITIPLDETLSAMENAKRYFERYTKLKRTAESLETHLISSEEELAHLESIRESLEYAQTEADLADIRRELTDFGYIRFKKDASSTNKKRRGDASKPYHYRTEEGFDIFVGKNNYQNDELTFRVASGSDWWFHAKGIPGSHVLLRSGGEAVPDHVYEIAGSLAAYYSKNRTSGKVEVDYLERRNVKKPSGAKPGFVVYYTNYSLMATPEIAKSLTLVED